MVNTTPALFEMGNTAGGEDAGLAQHLLDEGAPEQSAANRQARAANGDLRSPPGCCRRPGRCCGLSWLGGRLTRREMVLLTMLAVSLTFLIVSVTFNIYQALTKSPQAPVAPNSLCPQGWLRHGNWHYFFSDRESNWTDSQNNCSSLGGSLARLETETEKDFIMNNVKKDLYWLGIRRKDQEPWDFPKVSIFHNLSLNEREGNCAFLNEDRVDSSVCSISRLWICRKPLSAH